MFKSATLQTRLIGACVLMGGIVLVTAFIGWNGNNRLNGHINALGRNSLPSMNGLWKINEGQTQIQSSLRSLSNPNLDSTALKLEEDRIQEAWSQINSGFKEYEAAPQMANEADLYKNQFLPHWNQWKQTQEEFLRIFHTVSQDGQISPADVDKMEQFLAKQEREAFNASTADIVKLLNIDAEVAKEALANAEQDASLSTRWALMAMILGPAIVLVFGVYVIAKPLAGKIAGIVNAIASSSNEIAATVEQQERAAVEQATAVNQTTTTMDELGAASRQSADQAESAANSARQVLLLVDSGSQGDSGNGASLVEKVRQIADQILHLSEKTNQIGAISNIVSDLANQTNMLALNAAVESVRAGVNGKGFAVIAAEIRKLAEESRRSAERINTLVADVQSATHLTVMVTDEGNKTVGNVVETINGIVMNSQQIALTAKQQAIAIEQVVNAMNTINQSASQTAAGISQTRISTRSLNDAAKTLKEVV